jgi:hypothetical protein
MFVYIRLISSSNRTAPMPMINSIENQRRYSAKKVNDATAEMSTPISVKVKDMPVTIATGRSLLPTEPESTAGSTGRTHGVITVAMPAMKTHIADGAVGIYALAIVSKLSDSF